jgi:hypothetical protein
MKKSDIVSIAASTVFRKLPLDVVELLLRNQVVLDTMNNYARSRYGENFWNGDLSFNPNFRLVCPPTAFDVNPKMWPPFYKTVFLERAPFIPGENYAKFGINWRLDEPLLVK